MLNVTALSFNGDGFDCVQGRLKQEVKGRRQWLDGGSLAHAPESYKGKELISSQSLLLEEIRVASRTACKRYNRVSPNVVTVQNCSPYQNNLWKSSPDGRVGFAEQTGEFVNDVSSYLTMQYGAILEVVRERFSLVDGGHSSLAL